MSSVANSPLLRAFELSCSRDSLENGVEPRAGSKIVREFWRAQPFHGPGHLDVSEDGRDVEPGLQGDRLVSVGSQVKVPVP